MHLSESVGNAFDPLPADVGIDKAHIERLIAHEIVCPDAIDTVMPVMQTVDRNPRAE